jgi:hypothetical protein
VQWFEDANYNGGNIRHWHFTFAAFAVAMDMRGYIQHRLDIALDSPERFHFLNGKAGRPLLFFSVYLHGQNPKPQMTRLLLQQGADIHATFDDKTVIESLVIHESARSGAPHLDIVRLLLEHRANPNSRYIPDPGVPATWYPLLHIVAYLTNIDLGPRLRFMKQLKKEGADLNATDSSGRTFVEVLYWGDEQMPAPEWEWLFRNGAKITKRMVSLGAQRRISNAPETGSIRAEPSNSVYRPTHSIRSSTFSATSALLCNPYFLATGGKHDAFEVLNLTTFRKRDFYTLEAVQAIERWNSTWFRG